MAKTDIVQKIADIAKINKAEAGRALDIHNSGSKGW